MSDKLDQNEAEAEAARVLKDHGLSIPPIDPFVITSSSRIHVCAMASHEPGVAGCLLRVGNEFGIQYSRSLPNEGFIRFTVAHELGHYFISGHPEHLFPNGDGIHKSHGDFAAADRYERQADFFASSLLMPPDLFTKAMWKVDPGLEGISNLSKKFGTSLTATAISYARMVEIPLAIIVSNGSSIEYCILSNQLKSIPNLGWPKKGDPLSRTTATYRLNQRVDAGEHCDRLDGECNLDDWFEDAPEVEMAEESLRLGGYGKTMTVVYTEEDLDELLSEPDD